MLRGSYEGWDRVRYIDYSGVLYFEEQDDLQDTMQRNYSLPHIQYDLLTKKEKKKNIVICVSMQRICTQCLDDDVGGSSREKV